MVLRGWRVARRTRPQHATSHVHEAVLWVIGGDSVLRRHGAAAPSVRLQSAAVEDRRKNSQTDRQTDIAQASRLLLACSLAGWLTGWLAG
jgi:hypothetical protein